MYGGVVEWVYDTVAASYFTPSTLVTSLANDAKSMKRHLLSKLEKQA